MEMRGSFMSRTICTHTGLDYDTCHCPCETCGLEYCECCTGCGKQACECPSDPLDEPAEDYMHDYWLERSGL